MGMCLWNNMDKYKIIETNCVNSKWKAKFLAKKNEKFCQCPFGCKIKIRYKTGYEYIISKDEYLELKAKKQLEEWKNMKIYKKDDKIIVEIPFYSKRVNPGL